MKKLSWAAYGLGVLIVVTVLMSSEVGALSKSLLVVGTLFVGALIAAIHELARALVGSRRAASEHAPAEHVGAAR